MPYSPPVKSPDAIIRAVFVGGAVNPNTYTMYNASGLSWAVTYGTGTGQFRAVATPTTDLSKWSAVVQMSSYIAARQVLWIMAAGDAVASTMNFYVYNNSAVLTNPVSGNRIDVYLYNNTF